MAEDADLLRQTQTMRAISVAKSIDDISNSMAETLFGETDLGKLGDALAASGWIDDEVAAEPASPASPPPAPAATVPSATARAPQAPVPRPAQQPPAAKSAPPPPAPKPAPAPADDDPFDFLGLGRDAPLELIDDDAVAPQQHKEAARNR